ncbi:hypothetical protein [Nostoc sp.]|uniref:hypothetical protein n=1 Tax=Nostoc sp. TaxID=1180 RepID=UPI002FF8A462
MDNKPKRKTEVFKAGQVEEHEIGSTFEEIECPTCDGSGEILDDWEGIQSIEECSDCGGAGVMYVSI